MAQRNRPRVVRVRRYQLEPLLGTLAIALKPLAAPLLIDPSRQGHGRVA
jgi:hypothetical protein